MGLSVGDQGYVKKYLWYRGLENPEERFLGFFRLLEKLCFQKETFLPEEELNRLLERFRPFLARYFHSGKNVSKLIKGIRRWNQSKLDTASCIRRFMASLPDKVVNKWTYRSQDLEAICKLRNDLTHANLLESDKDDVAKKAKFIEVLLVIKLLELVGVATTDAAFISARLHRHYWIEGVADATRKGEQATVPRAPAPGTPAS
jgi:hypothetical protein